MTNRNQSLHRKLALAALTVLAAPAALAASGSWTTAINGNWSDPLNWTGGVPNASADIATLNLNWTGQTITVDAPITVGQILATDTTANGGLTIASGTLTLNNGAAKPILSTGTNNAFGETAANRFKITSTLAGSNGFERTGNGYFDISGTTNTFAGSIKLSAAASGGGSFTVISADTNLGDAANTIEVALTAQPVGFYNDASAGAFTVNSARTITTTGTGAFWVKNKAGANMTLAGAISGSAELRKNDSGILTLTAANSHTGGTRLDGGTLVLSGGNNRLPSGSVVTFQTASTLDLTSTTQSLNNLALLATATNTVRGTGGTLSLAGTGDYTVNATAAITSLNMTDLSNFTFSRPASSFQVAANGLNVVNTVNLAKSGTNTLSANNIRLGGGGSNVAGQNSVIKLGQSNLINVGNEFLIGYFQGSADVSFHSGLTNPSLTVRAADGSSPAPLFRVGQTNSGNQPTTGILNLTGGSLDAKAVTLDVAAHIAGANTNNVGTLTMPAGTVEAATLSIARKTNTTGVPTITGTMNQSGGTVSAASLILGNNESANAANLIANYNLTGGTLAATSISAVGTTVGANTIRNLSISGGTVRNIAGADLLINGLNATDQGELNLIVGLSGASLLADAARLINIASFTDISGAGILSKDGLGTLALNSAKPVLPAVDVNTGTLRGTSTLAGGLNVDPLAIVAPGNGLGSMPVSAAVIDGILAIDWQDNGLAINDGLIDLLPVTATLDISGSTLALTDLLGTSVANDTAYVLATYGTLTGTFATVTGLPTGYDIDYAYNNNSIAMVPIPEPSALALAALAAPALLRRRRA
jgi:autotransporter-associated beta strand protein